MSGNIATPLDEITAILKACGVRHMSMLPRGPEHRVAAQRFCPSCRGTHRHFLYLEASRYDYENMRLSHAGHFESYFAVFGYVCGSCDARSYVLMNPGDNPTWQRISAPTTSTGLSTPHTPIEVKRWLDEAQRAQRGGALAMSAAAYRVALDQALLLEGCGQRTLGHKLEAFNKAIAERTAPAWAHGLDTELLKSLKDVADKTLHADDGTVDPTVLITDEVLAAIANVITVFLDVAYESSERTQATRRTLASALKALRPES